MLPVFKYCSAWLQSKWFNRNLKHWHFFFFTKKIKNVIHRISAFLSDPEFLHFFTIFTNQTKPSRDIFIKYSSQNISFNSYNDFRSAHSSLGLKLFTSRLNQSALCICARFTFFNFQLSIVRNVVCNRKIICSVSPLIVNRNKFTPVEWVSLWVVTP